MTMNGYGRYGFGEHIDSVLTSVRDDLRDIDRRLDALETGGRASKPEPREVGWYPVELYAGASPTCAWWDGKCWRPNSDRGRTFLTADNVTWIGPRLDLPEGR